VARPAVPSEVLAGLLEVPAVLFQVLAGLLEVLVGLRVLTGLALGG